MAEYVAPMITDAVTQANVKTLGDAPAMAMGTLFQTAAHAAGLAIQNAVNSQQQLYMASQAATVQGVALIYAVDTAATAEASEKIDQSDIPRWAEILRIVNSTGRP